jgi:hypothetical protein
MFAISSGDNCKRGTSAGDDLFDLTTLDDAALVKFEDLIQCCPAGVFRRSWTMPPQIGFKRHGRRVLATGIEARHHNADCGVAPTETQLPGLPRLDNDMLLDHAPIGFWQVRQNFS